MTTHLPFPSRTPRREIPIDIHPYRAEAHPDFRFGILTSIHCTSERLRWSILLILFVPSDSGARLNSPSNAQTADQVAPVRRLGAAGPSVPFYDPPSFRQPTETRFGATGREFRRGPGQVNVNASLFRTLPITERLKMEFRAELFHFTNTPHFNNPLARASNVQLNADGTLRNLGGEWLEQLFRNGP